MKKLKNWFIGFKTIKGGAAGLINIADYIYNNKHKNHVKNGHEIVAFEAGNSEKILQNILHIQQSKENFTTSCMILSVTPFEYIQNNDLI